jgi:membrane protease YdiL (CAAX protease family)
MNKGMNFELFFISVIGMSFSLGAIHYVSKSLWLCVLFHALVNALSQLISVNSDINTVILSTIFRIIFSLFLVYVVQGKNSKQNINEKNS